ncbi:MAG: class I SAM-dependent methyltransferase [Anaerolineales bacterium]|jgi:SAM-dependent methyltransferase
MLTGDAVWEDVVHCSLCRSGQEMHSVFAQLEDAGERLHYQICDRCGLVFQSPRMNQSALSRFYMEQYRKTVQDSEGPTDKDLRVQAGRARALSQFVHRDAAEIRRHLDIGSSAGALLARFRSDYSCESVGIEPGEAYRAYAAKRKLRMYPDLETLERQDEAAFDLVSMSHVLEHLPDPLAYLIHLRRRWIAPDGWVLIEVPNLYGHQAFELAHLYAYTAATLREVLRQAGFEVLRLRAHGRPRSRLIPLYLTALARPRSGDSAPGRIRSDSSGVRTRRRLAMLWRRMATKYFARWAWLPWPALE